jgi:LysM repeat protein
VGLAKATITPEGGAPIKVLFNPNQYSLDQGNQIAEIGVPGLAAPVLQYVRGNVRKLSMELFFDTYEAGEDVRTYTSQIYGLLDIVASKHRPPICTFAWGQFNLKCLLESVSGKFTLFLEDGTPVRATLNVSFKEYLEVEVLVKGPPTQSADHAKTYVVRRGETLSSIAAAEYDDPGQWRVIADANGISNPMSVRPGQKLKLPAVVT